MAALLVLPLAATAAPSAPGAHRQQGAASPQPAEAAERVVVTRIEGPLAEAMLATLGRAVARAESEQAAALVIEIDTPGGEVGLMDRIGRRLELSKVQPVAYVVNEAVSAGAYIAMACERIFTFERAQIGSSYPIAISPIGPLPEGAVDPNITEKNLSYLRSKFRDLAQSHERPGMAALAEAMVDPDVEVLLVRTAAGEVPMTRGDYEDLARRDGRSAAAVVRTISAKGNLLNLTAQEAFELGFTDGIVLSREELLAALGLAGARLIEIAPSWSERLVALLESVQWLLLVAGLVLLYVEFKAPGFGVAGALGILCIALLLFKNYLVGLAEVPEILLVVLGVMLLAVELFVLPGFGAAGIAGITCIALGVIFSFLPFLVPEGPVETSLLKETIRNFSISLVATLCGAYGMSRYVLPKTPLFGRMILDTGASPATLVGSAASLGTPDGAGVEPGRRGVAVSDLRPAGKVEIGGGLLDAMTEGDYIERGAAVEITVVRANHVVVRRARGAREEKDGG